MVMALGPTLGCKVSRYLDVENVEKFITTELAKQTGTTPSKVECPKGVVEARVSWKVTGVTKKPR